MKICKIENCNSKHHAIDYCQKHYTRFWRYGNPFHSQIGREREKHGMTGNSEYEIWQQMKNRCYNEKCKEYCWYGGRGIAVCNRWKNSFISFYKDMGPKPFPKAQIDRIDNDGNYEPNNCRWVTSAQNGQHTSMTKLTMKKAKEIRELYGVGHVLQKELAKEYGVHKSLISLIVTNRIWKQ